MDEAMFLANNSVDSGSATDQLFEQSDSNVADSFTEWDSLDFALEDSVALNDCTTLYEPLYRFNLGPEAIPMEDESAPLYESAEQEEEEAMPLLVLEDAQATEYIDHLRSEAINNGLPEDNNGLLMLDWRFPKEEENGRVEEVTVPLLVQPNFLNAAGTNQSFELTDFVLHEAIHNEVPEENLLPDWMFPEVNEVAVPPLVPEQLVSLQELATHPTFCNAAEVTEDVKVYECVLREAIDPEAEQRLLEGDLVPSWMLRGAMSDFVYIRKSFGTKPYSEYYRVIPADSNGVDRVPNRLPKPELIEDPVVMELVNDPAEESAFVDRMLARAGEGAAFAGAAQESKPELYKYYNLSVVGNITEPTPPKPTRKRSRKRMLLTKSPDRPKKTRKM